MKKFNLVSILLSFGICTSNYLSANDFKSHIEERSFYFGDNEVKVTKYVVAGKNNITYVNIHENEWTSISQAKNKLFDDGGILFLLNHEKTRKIRARGKNFDPNRIYTNSGLFHSVSKRDVSSVKKFSNYLFSWIFEDTNSIIALHNNTNGRYSIKSYLSSGNLSKDALKVNYNPNLDPDDFYFTTNEFVFKYFKEKKYNVILQSPGAKDDGSLSIYAEQNNIDYINVECEFGHSKIQRKMIDDATKVLNILNQALYL